MKISFIFIGFALLSCNLQEPSKSGVLKIPQIDSVSKTVSDENEKSIDGLTNFIWSPAHPNTGGYFNEIKFEDEYAMISFHGQCIYFFFTYNEQVRGVNQIQLLWSYKKDCILDMAFLEKPNGVKRYPKHGDNFASYRQINDSTLDVEYAFPEWVLKINQIANDSIFPRRLYSKHQGG